MKRLVSLCAISALAVTMMGCNGGSGNHDADVASIKANEVQWNADWAAHNADKVLAHYADDAVLIVPESPAASGKAAIAASMKMMIADPGTVLKWQPKRVEVASSGDIAYTQGTYTMDVKDMQSGKVVNDHGNYVTTYKKQTDGSWLAVVDIVTSEVPQPMPAPAAAETDSK